MRRITCQERCKFQLRIRLVTNRAEKAVNSDHFKCCRLQRSRSKPRAAARVAFIFKVRNDFKVDTVGYPEESNMLWSDMRGSTVQLYKK